MIKWLNTPEQTKRNAYIQIAERTGMSSFAVEKDWWVVQTLSIIFEMDVARHLVFKGGTSLSKAWNLIERFSEDIDLALDREFLGFNGKLTKKQRTELRKAASAYTSGNFLNSLKVKFEEKAITGVTFNLVDAKDSDQDPRIIEMYYPNVIETPGYMQPKLLLEIGCRSPREPFTMRTITSMVDNEYAEMEFSQSSIIVPAVNPERTFLEKIFLLHEEFHRPIEKVRVDRLSRHLYDIYHLSKTEFANKALNNKELYETIVNHRFNFAHVGGVNYNQHQPQTINPVPIPEVFEAWRADYNTMLEQMIYEQNPPSFEEIIASLYSLRDRINNLPWRMTRLYPAP
ncbi:MAG: nucleotidyl transferase AbiEii/AbiGii toxin family protein [Bacteroidota bacterium]